MKRFVREYADYNLWANQRLGEVILTLDDEKLDWNIVSSFPSIRQTLLHIWDAQLIWLNRLQGQSITSWPSADFKGSKLELIAGLTAASLELKQVAFAARKKDLSGKVAYQNMNGDPFVNSVYGILCHVFNHSTYHRGQLTTMLRQAGVTQLPSNDLIFYYRERKKYNG